MAVLRQAEIPAEEPWTLTHDFPGTEICFHHETGCGRVFFSLLTIPAIPEDQSSPTALFNIVQVRGKGKGEGEGKGSCERPGTGIKAFHLFLTASHFEADLRVTIDSSARIVFVATSSNHSCRPRACEYSKLEAILRIPYGRAAEAGLGEAVWAGRQALKRDGITEGLEMILARTTEARKKAVSSGGSCTIGKIPGKAAPPSLCNQNRSTRGPPPVK
jgi:hypothetical protein